MIYGKDSLHRGWEILTYYNNVILLGDINLDVSPSVKAKSVIDYKKVPFQNCLQIKSSLRCQVVGRISLTTLVSRFGDHSCFGS